VLSTASFESFDFLANIEDLTSIPQGPTGLEAWPDVLVRLTAPRSFRSR